jgi:hypothetical protein
MADTARSYAALLTALADNQVGAITPQTIRDLIVSGMGCYGVLAGSTTDVEVPYYYIGCTGTPNLVVGETITQASGATAKVLIVITNKVIILTPLGSPNFGDWTGSLTTFTPSTTFTAIGTGWPTGLYVTDPSVKSEMTADTVNGTLTPTVPGWYLAIATGTLYNPIASQSTVLTLSPNAITDPSASQITYSYLRKFTARTNLEYTPFFFAEVFDMTNTQSAIGLVGCPSNEQTTVKGGSLVVLRVR